MHKNVQLISKLQKLGFHKSLPRNREQTKRTVKDRCSTTADRQGRRPETFLVERFQKKIDGNEILFTWSLIIFKYKFLKFLYIY